MENSQQLPDSPFDPARAAQNSYSAHKGKCPVVMSSAGGGGVYGQQYRDLKTAKTGLVDYLCATLGGA